MTTMRKALKRQDDQAKTPAVAHSPTTVRRRRRADGHSGDPDDLVDHQVAGNRAVLSLLDRDGASPASRPPLQCQTTRTGGPADDVTVITSKTLQKRGEQAHSRAATHLPTTVRRRADEQSDGLDDLVARHWAVSGSPDCPVQAKHTAGPAGDVYEREADHVAKQVARRIHQPGTASASGSPAPTWNSEVRTVRKKPVIQRHKDALEGADLPRKPEASIEGARGAGRKLTEPVKSSMEQALGADYSSVRVYTGHESDMLNDSLQVKTFTSGCDVSFSRGSHKLVSREGQELITHESTHVEQQNRGAVPSSASEQMQHSHGATPQTILEREREARAEVPSYDSGSVGLGKVAGVMGHEAPQGYTPTVGLCESAGHRAGNCVRTRGVSRVREVGSSSKHTKTSAQARLVQRVSKDLYSGKELIKFNKIRNLLKSSRSGYTYIEVDRILQGVSYLDMGVILRWSDEFIDSLQWNMYALDILKNPHSFYKVINDATKESEAKTNCAIVTVAALTGKGKSSDVTGSHEQPGTFFKTFLLKEYPALEKSHDDQELQTLGMVWWIFKDQKEWPVGWHEERFANAVNDLKSDTELNDQVTRTVAEAEEWMMTFRKGSEFAVLCTEPTLSNPHWLVARNLGTAILYTDNQPNRPKRDVHQVAAKHDVDSTHSSAFRSFSDDEMGDSARSFDSDETSHERHGSPPDEESERGEYQQHVADEWDHSGINPLYEETSQHQQDAQDEIQGPTQLPPAEAMPEFFNTERNVVARIKYKDLNRVRKYTTPVWYRDHPTAQELLAIKATVFISIIPHT